MAVGSGRWTDESVVAFAEGGNPIEKMERVAREAVLAAVDEGWRGPPFDPIELAGIRQISVRPNAAVTDARVFLVNERFEIEYNPHKPRARVNFSIAHEIAHTFFADCATAVRHRSRKDWDDHRWELELLCNIGAAELMMPVGSFPSNEVHTATIEDFMRLRQKYQVSAEAILIRSVKQASSRVACFSATRLSDPRGSTEYRMDYRIASSRWLDRKGPRRPSRLTSCVLDQCVAIGRTAKGTEQWEPNGPTLHVEAVALPPLPGAGNLRVAGLIRPASDVAAAKGVGYQHGNAATFVVESDAALLHIVNDRASRWGPWGFARVLRTEYPSAYEDYASWATGAPKPTRLGAAHVAHLDGNRHIVSLVAQKGYGKSAGPRIRYVALDLALRNAQQALLKAGVKTVQMPRIGTGQARGNWSVIEGLIRERLVSAGFHVIVFDLPPA